MKHFVSLIWLTLLGLAITTEMNAEGFFIQSLAQGNPHASRSIENVDFIGGSNKIVWKQSNKGLTIRTEGSKPCKAAYAFRIQFTD